MSSGTFFSDCLSDIPGYRSELTLHFKSSRHFHVDLGLVCVMRNTDGPTGWNNARMICGVPEASAHREGSIGSRSKAVGIGNATVQRVRKAWILYRSDRQR